MPEQQDPMTETLDHFLTELASGQPVPGGGSASALTGALAASLFTMVSNLTVGKKGYEAVSQDMENLIPTLEKHNQKLRNLVKADIYSYGMVIHAYQMPRESESAKKSRTAAIQSALVQASDVPLEIAATCLALLESSLTISEKGNKNALSDAGVGVLLADAGLRGAAMNVSINLSAIQDKAYVADRSRRIQSILVDGEDKKKIALEIIEARQANVTR